MPGQFQFPRQERLTRKRDYEAVYEHGRKRVGRAFVCYVVRREGQGRKIGWAISRKIGKAVVRNRLKRYMREIYRKHRAEIPEDLQVVLVARPASAELNYTECEQAIWRLLNQANLGFARDTGSG